MRTNKGTHVALNALFRIPLRHHHCRTALFILGGPQRHRTVGRVNKNADGNVVALQTVDRDQHLADIVGKQRINAFFRRLILGICPFRRHFDADHAGAATVDCLVVHAKNLVALRTVSAFDRFLHVLHGVFERQNARQLEKRRLQHGVCAVPHADFHGDAGSVDDVKIDMFTSQIPFDGSGKMPLQIFRFPGAVQQEGAAVFQLA